MVKKFLRGMVRSACRLYPLMGGCATIANSAMFRRLTSEQVEITSRLRNGSRIIIELDDLIGRSIYFFGDLDPKVTWVCRRVLRKGDTVLDIGANFGVITLYAADRVGPSGLVHAFEPQPDIAQMLRHSADSNGYNNINVHPVALSDRDGEFALSMCEGNRGTASLEQSWGNRAASAGRVPVRHASVYLRGLDLPPIRLLKVDVEGHESAVFRGAQEFLADNPPSVVIFEAFQNYLKWWEMLSVRLLAEWGYKLFAIPRVKWRMRLLPMDLSKPIHLPGHDIVAVHRPDDNREVLRALRVG